jgi:nucleolar GTP-binding protein
MEALPVELQARFAALQAEGVVIMPMSNVTTDGVTDVRNKACDMLLAHRVEVKMRSSRVAEVAHRMRVAVRPFFLFRWPSGFRRELTPGVVFQ